MIYTKCSDGTEVSQATIDKMLSQSYREKYWNISVAICECCNLRMSINSDHTIAQARCKKLHKTELIWHKHNYVRSCEICHRQWENFKSGEWVFHLNSLERLLFLKENDPEGYNIRINFTIASLNENIENEPNTQTISGESR